MTTESPTWRPAVSTAATLSLSDCRHAASLSEMESSTRTSAFSGRSASSLKQPGRSKPMAWPPQLPVAFFAYTSPYRKPSMYSAPKPERAPVRE